MIMTIRRYQPKSTGASRKEIEQRRANSGIQSTSFLLYRQEK